MLIPPPISEIELIARTQQLTGLTLGHLQSRYQLKEDIHNKGNIGLWFEKILGADAGNAAAPDFSGLGIELKTLPIGNNGKPCESTFVSSIALMQLAQESWLTSRVYRKLNHVLWIPIEGDRHIPLLQRRIGEAFLWRPNAEQLSILQADWEELTRRMLLGELETISAKDGVYLQVRPKGADGRSLAWGLDERGNKIKTLPRGFYLRAIFTAQLLDFRLI